MVSICFYFQVHQPVKLKNFRVFDIGNDDKYFDEERNRSLMFKAATQTYIPMNNVLLNLAKRHGKKFRVSLSISGTTLEMMEKYNPEVLNSFKELATTGCVEFLAETYYHSLSFLYSKGEFKRQIELHSELIKKHFGQTPKVFRNTELIYTNELASFLENDGYKGVVAEGEPSMLGLKSPNCLYKANTKKSKITLFARNKKLSNDIAMRFSNSDWDDYPLTSSKYVKWLKNQEDKSQIINLFMNYEVFGQRHKKESGIFDFFEDVVDSIMNDSDFDMMTPSMAIRKYSHKEPLDAPFVISWGEDRKDLHQWLGNQMQKGAIQEIYALEEPIKKLKNKDLLVKWRMLTTSDHFYDMCTNYLGTEKQCDDSNPYDSYIHFMNVLNDIIVRMKLNEKKTFIKDTILKNPKKSVINDIKLAIKGN